MSRLRSTPLEALTARDVMNAPVEVIPQDMPLREAARVLARARTNCVPVVDAGGRCVGVLPAGDRLHWPQVDPPTRATTCPLVAPIRSRGDC
jgi:CBS domain-containing protein